ncbi:hypothetical protein [Ralstonia mannitolilytica]|uniref:Uncharacterized protein n=1 Tax=Ralstonia mannitolilytica TaxID=105219 RepID=A0AAJ4ZKW9_9RALS|nr:hypothetical protein [Ralstonia mannitolilytica]CAG2139805.1 hypothetical protein LMG6866_01947 [Ralstonia mannitolilytica]CAJ0729264.1 hypothetical protein R77592_01941 [Ralstonia mannitolilytica]SUD87811.1 Uncharacterised protein [Ralstonia mannitolilytica]SUD93721.1 Uncharacterised protein [Ralstonia mannitolilytica]SUD97471.1 Uncharacterised protein [Ralstonia mannitolilytica]
MSTTRSQKPATRNVERAHDLMREHFQHIEQSLDLHATPTSALDLESIFKRT